MTSGAFVLNIKPGLIDMVAEARAHRRLLIGWGDADGLLDESLSYKDVRTIIHQVFHPEKQSLRSAAAEAGSVWRFLREMKPGDLVVVPHHDMYYVTQVLGNPIYCGIGSSDRFFYQRAADWLNADAPLPRKEAPASLREAMKRRLTCSDVRLLRNEIEGIIRANQFTPHVADEREVMEDIADVRRRYKAVATQRDALVAARIGQGAFREGLLSRWGRACAVSGCTVAQAIRASHVKPWRSSTDEERLDPDNGLPLVASVDALFDAGLVAFKDSGEMLVSRLISGKQRRLLGIPCRLRKRPSTKQQVYLQFHRQNRFVP